MFADERKLKILSLLQSRQSVTVNELVNHLQTSESTVRRDLQDLEKQDQLKRTHGGAVSNGVASFEPSIQEKVVYHAPAKEAIADEAVSLIHEGDTVLLDSGTTTGQIASKLPDRAITIVTNSQQIGEDVTQLRKARLLFLGGELRPTTGAFVGHFTELLLSQIHVDTLFLGANGIDLEHGVTTPNSTEAATKKAMIHAARETFLVADHSKLGQTSLVKICDVADLNGFITDLPLSNQQTNILHEQQVKILSATKKDKEGYNDGEP